MSSSPLLVRFETVDSTQRVARTLAEEGMPHGTIVMADSQTGGRGTHGRRWYSPAGLNLYATAILRPQIPLRETPLLSLGVAAFLAERLQLKVKWPNDLVTEEGKKVAGILAELETNGAELRYVLMGIGLNINQREFPEELPMATSLACLRGPQDREEILNIVCDALLIGATDPEGLARWRRHAHTLGKRVQIGNVCGIAEAIREDGALIVDGTPIFSGEPLY